MSPRGSNFKQDPNSRFVRLSDKAKANVRQALEREKLAAQTIEEQRLNEIFSPFFNGQDIPPLQEAPIIDDRTRKEFGAPTRRQPRPVSRSDEQSPIFPQQLVSDFNNSSPTAFNEDDFEEEENFDIDSILDKMEGKKQNPADNFISVTDVDNPNMMAEDLEATGVKILANMGNTLAVQRPDGKMLTYSKVPDGTPYDIRYQGKGYIL